MNGNNGFTASGLTKLHDVLARHVDSGKIPGLVALVSRGGQTHVEAIGTMRHDGGAPMRRDTIFRMASTTKPVAASAAMVLLDECRLRLDDPIDRWLPELADRQVLKAPDGPLDETVPALRPINVRDVLTSTLGLGLDMTARTAPMMAAFFERGVYGQADGWLLPEPDPDEWLRRLATLPLMYQPGERWLYNLGDDLLGVLVARVTGRPFEDFLRERVLEPLGMHDTGFHVPGDKIDRLPPLYAPHPETGEFLVEDPAEGGHHSKPPAFASGGGGLDSTVDDYHACFRMLLDGGKHGGERILSKPAVELMTTNRLTPGQQAARDAWANSIAHLSYGTGQHGGWGFGMTVRVHRTDYAPLGQFGWDGGAGITAYADPPTISSASSAPKSACPPRTRRGSCTTSGPLSTRPSTTDTEPDNARTTTERPSHRWPLSHSGSDSQPTPPESKHVPPVQRVRPENGKRLGKHPVSTPATSPIPAVLANLGPLDTGRIADLRPYLDSVPDPRSRRGRWYSLTTILLVCACATVSGAKSIDELAEWAARAGTEILEAIGLRRHLLRWRTSPSRATIGRVLERIDGDALDRAIGAYLADRHRTEADNDDRPWLRRVIAVDGKALKGSARTGRKHRHLLSALTQGIPVTIAQVEVGSKTGETKHFKPLLAPLDLVGAVITFDALHTVQEHACWLVKTKKAHYIAVVKLNQPTAHGQISALPWNQVPIQHTASGRGHGRTESRSIKTMSVADNLGGIAFPDAKLAIRVHRRRKETGKKETRETVYAVTSLDAHQATPAELAAWTGGHWAIDI